MQPAALLPDILITAADFVVLQQRVVAAGVVDLHQILVDDPAAADIEVPHLAVAHLALRKAHILAAGGEVAVRISGSQGVDFRRAGGIDGIGGIGRAFSPAVEDHQ